METVMLTVLLEQIHQDLHDALGTLSIDIVKPQSSETAEALQVFRERLARFALEAEALAKQWVEITKQPGPVDPPPSTPGVLHLKDKVGDASLDQTQQMLNLIETEGVAKVYVICKKHHIVATRKTTHLFVDKEPYTLAQPAKPIQGEDGYPYYVYCCMSMEQKQKRLDEVAKWL